MPNDYTIVRRNDPEHPSSNTEYISVAHPDGERNWTFEGSKKGPATWTDEEIAQANAIISRYPYPIPNLGHRVASWYLWKSAWGIQSDQIKYSIGLESASHIDYVRADRYDSLDELLRGWSTIQDNTWGKYENGICPFQYYIERVRAGDNIRFPRRYMRRDFIWDVTHLSGRLMMIKLPAGAYGLQAIEKRLQIHDPSSVVKKLLENNYLPGKEEGEG